jgi:hypothetical protein
MVNATEAWPSRSETTFGWTPAPTAPTAPPTQPRTYRSSGGWELVEVILVEAAPDEPQAPMIFKRPATPPESEPLVGFGN